MAGKLWVPVHAWLKRHFGQDTLNPALNPTEPMVTEPSPFEPVVYPVRRDVDISKDVIQEEVGMAGERTAAGKTVAKVPGVDKLTTTQLNALHDAATDIGIPVDWLATVISFESGGTFSPKVDNKAGSGAFGLIQFMPKTAQSLLKTATPASAVLIGKGMSFEEQLQRMVVPYLKWYQGKYNSLSDVYLAIFYPAAMNKSDDWVIGKPGTAVYTQNKGFDKSGKGYITRADVTSKINNLLNNALGLVTIGTGGTSSSGFMAIAITMLLTGLGYASWIDLQHPNSRIRAGGRTAEAFIRKHTPVSRRLAKG